MHGAGAPPRRGTRRSQCRSASRSSHTSGSHCGLAVSRRGHTSPSSTPPCRSSVPDASKRTPACECRRGPARGSTPCVIDAAAAFAGAVGAGLAPPKGDGGSHDAGGGDGDACDVSHHDGAASSRLSVAVASETTSIARGIARRAPSPRSANGRCRPPCLTRQRPRGQYTATPSSCTDGSRCRRRAASGGTVVDDAVVVVTVALRPRCATVAGLH